MNRLRWKILPPPPAGYLALYPDGPPLLAQLLYNRGITDPSQVGPFLAADARLDNDPALLPDIDRAVARILRALLANETIAVFGDFDADGVTATALLVEGLTRLGGKALRYIPHRVEEGHGLNRTALEKLRRQGAALVITVDCGITACAEAEQARELGLDLVITDHHLVTTAVPRAAAVVNPHLENSRYPCRQLAGVGVAYKVLQQLYRATGRGSHADEFLDLVVLGTVADLVPLAGENRYLVKRGLEVLNTTERIGIKAMLDCAGLVAGQLDTESISFGLAPRINAAGRLDHAYASYDLLTADSPERARELAAHLESRNTERQELTAQLLANAESKLLPLAADTPLLMVGDGGFNAGVNGVVAGKLVDRFYRPALVIETGPEETMGSARSIPEFNIVAALSECQELISHFGGHAQAAGFTLPTENVELLHQRLLDIAQRELAGVVLQPTIEIEVELPLSQLGGSTYGAISMLQPFGKGNPMPAFLSRHVNVVEWRRVGNRGQHLKLKLRDGDMVWDAIGFDLGNNSNQVAGRVDVVYNLRSEIWGGQERLQLVIVDLAPSS